MPLPTMSRVRLTALVLVGCASGRSTLDDANGGSMADSKVYLDGQIEGTPDAPVMPPADAQMADATTVLPADAAQDAYQCTVMTQQKLLNPVFDLTPVGVNWVMVNVDAGFPVVTADDGIPEHTAPYKAFMGGWEAIDFGASSVTDQLYQDVTLPMGVTMLRLTGMYEVRTAETGGTIYDTAQVRLLQPNATPIESVISLSNVNPTTAWTAIDKMFANPAALSGQTVRLHFTSTCDITNSTAFFFDTLALTVTYCL
jgi:hypothetical protein